MRDEADAVLLGHPRDAPLLADAADLRHVGLHDVERPLLEPRGERLPLRQDFAARDRHRRMRYRPPSNRPTGCPVTLPRMSHIAISIPLMACVTDPPRPIQKVCWRSFSLTRSGSSGFSPRHNGVSRRSAPRTSSSLVNTE